MPRVDIRCKVDLPVSLIQGNSQNNAKEKNAQFSVISLNGALVDCKQSSSQDKVIGLRYDLPKHGEFEMLGKIVRKEKKGIAVKFHNVHRDAKIKLWDYIKEHIVEGTKCPYCAAENTRRVRNCIKCGWTLNFNAPDYLVQHEKESFINRLATKCDEFTIEDIYKILNFVDMEVLGIGKSWEINEEFVGSSRPMLEVFTKIRKTASTDLPVLITGESGTGKELTARAIHERSSRKENPFVPIDCGAIPADFLEKELFGSDSIKTGKFEFADEGTVFLANIDALTPNIQSKLLKFLEIKNGEDKNNKKINVRLVTATAKNLRSLVSQGKFRKDLFSRLNSLNINLKPVSERDDDKVILARYFINKFSREMGLDKTFTNDALDIIKSYDWPGNVREIINKTRRAVILSFDSEVSAQDLDINIPISDISAIPSLRAVKSTIEKQKLIEALSVCKNNISKTASVLGISRPSVYSLKKKYEL